jgi:hypothetical protein
MPRYKDFIQSLHDRAVTFYIGALKSDKHINKYSTIWED